MHTQLISTLFLTQSIEREETPTLVTIGMYPPNHQLTQLYNFTFHREQGINNAAADWYFMNSPDTLTGTAALPEGTSLVSFLDETTKFPFCKPLFQASTIGWTPVDVRSKKWGYSVAKYGTQQQTECTRGDASWCTSDAGNGLRTDGTTKVTGNDPLDTSKPINETYTTRLMSFLKSRGTPVKLWALDNEPNIWHGTHFDVHPKPLTYDELWNYTVKYGSAIKKQDSSTLVFGPVSSGICGYYFSPADADSCQDGSDKASHSNLPLLAFYMKQVSDYYTKTGVKVSILKTLLIHFK